MSTVKITYMITSSTLQFLKELAQNNEREWFHAHAGAYAAAKQNVLNTAQALMTEICRFDASLNYVDPKRCLFRIARDTRFSHDKSPYKPNFGLLFHALGTKAKAGIPGYYLHIQPDNSFVSCGIYCPPPDILRTIRKSIYDNWEEFNAILHPPTPVAWEGLYRDEDALKRVPNGFPKEHPSAPCLMLKHFYLLVPLTDAALQSPDLTKKAAGHYQTMQPFNRFMEEAIGGTDN
ncbi:MAG: DUF2461 domain-containing protein [Bacteroidales bacterium]|nr:DUF2461 domain-containing protein [Bacteroidales bacterium]